MGPSTQKQPTTNPFCSFFVFIEGGTDKWQCLTLTSGTFLVCGQARVSAVVTQVSRRRATL